MTDKDVVYTVKIDLKSHELHLCRFPAVDKEMSALDFHKLRGRMSAVSGHCTA